jgi:hypothetical protein
MHGKNARSFLSLFLVARSAVARVVAANIYTGVARDTMLQRVGVCCAGGLDGRSPIDGCTGTITYFIFNIISHALSTRSIVVHT